MSDIILSIDESIQRLKAEIIAQDWGLSTKRIDLLEAAFACLQERFKSRKAAHAILIMAGSVLDYVKRKGENTPSNSIDFLKEAMAHIVNLYEADTFDPESEEKLFNGLFYRFKGLKKKIKEEKEREEGKETEPPDEDSSKESPPDVPKEEDISDLFVSDNIEQIFIPETIDRIKERIVSLHTETDTDRGLSEVDLLIDDLQMSLERAENVGSTIKQLVANLQTVREGFVGANNKVEEDNSENSVASHEVSGMANMPDEQPKRVLEVHSIKKCAPKELRGLIFDGVSLYVEEAAISMIKEISAVRQRDYIRHSSVPLKDFCLFFFSNLAKQFKGSLRHVPNKKLKKLTLPIMIPKGLDLPDAPDPDARTLVCVANGQWNGAFLCSSVSNETITMVKFQKNKNGDILGNGFCEAGEVFSLLDTVTVLRREGFLAMI
jgi:hypothetical protein